MTEKYPGVQIDVNPTAPRKKSFELVLHADKAAAPGRRRVRAGRTRPSHLTGTVRRVRSPVPRARTVAVVIWSGLGKGPAERYPATADVLAERITKALAE